MSVDGTEALASQLWPARRRSSWSVPARRRSQGAQLEYSRVQERRERILAGGSEWRSSARWCRRGGESLHQKIK